VILPELTQCVNHLSVTKIDGNWSGLGRAAGPPQNRSHKLWSRSNHLLQNSRRTCQSVRRARWGHEASRLERNTAGDLKAAGTQRGRWRGDPTTLVQASASSAWRGVTRGADQAIGRAASPVTGSIALSRCGCKRYMRTRHCEPSRKVARWHSEWQRQPLWKVACADKVLGLDHAVALQRRKLLGAFAQRRQRRRCVLAKLWRRARRHNAK